MNFNDIFDYDRPKQTLYDILGCAQSSSVEQITREYKIKALQYHPDKNPGIESLEVFRKIQEAKDILTDESLRKSYDTWLNSRINIPFQQWLDRKVHSMHWTSSKSTKLSIKDDATRGQGSDSKRNNRDPTQYSSESREDWLGKFRNYEI